MRIVRGSEIDYEPASHEDPEKPGVLKRVLATNSDLQAGQVQMLNWSLLKVGKSFEKHYHEDMQEIFVLIAGRANMICDGVSSVIAAGDVAIIEPQEVHQMKNVGEVDVFYLVFGISSGSHGKTVRVK